MNKLNVIHELREYTFHPSTTEGVEPEEEIILGPGRGFGIISRPVDSGVPNGGHVFK